MTKEDAISSRNSWQNTKTLLERKLTRLKNANTSYSGIVYSGSWFDFMSDFNSFKKNVDPAFQAVDWEGQKVSEYKNQLDAIGAMLKNEESNHYNVLTTLSDEIRKLQQKITDAQEQIDYWQGVIDNWVDEEETE